MASPVRPSKRAATKELDSLDIIASPVKSAKLHGVVTNVSPMKSGRGNSTYFDGHLSDGTSRVVRVVGFNQDHQEKMALHCRKKEPIVLDNCQVKKSKFGEKYEVIVNESTEISPSTKEISYNHVEDTANNLVDLPTISCSTNITVRIKVLEVRDTEEVKQGLKKQDVLISDKTGNAILTLWQLNIGSLEDGKSYVLQDVSVREFNSSKYLSFLHSSAIIPIDDIEGTTMNNAEVIAVASLVRKSICILCDNNVNETSENVGICESCNASQKLAKCKFRVSATLVLSNGSNNNLKLQAPWSVLTAINEDIKEEFSDEDIIEALLLAPPFTLNYHSNTIDSIYK